MAVALLAEGVDRNGITYEVTGRATVALLAEGVDRNKRKVVVEMGKKSRPPRGGRG